jgi:hypothetical protein
VILEGPKNAFLCPTLDFIGPKFDFNEKKRTELGVTPTTKKNKTDPKSDFLLVLEHSDQNFSGSESTFFV